MAQSTCALIEEVARPDTRAHRSAAERGRRREMRTAVTRDIEAKGLGAVMRVISESCPRLGSVGMAAAHITCQTALVLGGMWTERRAMRPSEATTFHALSDLSGRAGLSEDDAVASVEAGWNELLSLVRQDARGGPWSDRTKAAMLRELEEEAQAFTVAATKELRLGLMSELPHGESRVGVLRRALDGRLVGDQLGAAATAAGLDASREHGVVLLVDTKGRTRALDDAAREVEDYRPQHHRPRSRGQPSCRSPPRLPCRHARPLDRGADHPARHRHQARRSRHRTRSRTDPPAPGPAVPRHGAVTGRGHRGVRLRQRHRGPRLREAPRGDQGWRRRAAGRGRGAVRPDGAPRRRLTFVALSRERVVNVAARSLASARRCNDFRALYGLWGLGGYLRMPQPESAFRQAPAREGSNTRADATPHAERQRRGRGRPLAPSTIHLHPPVFVRMTPEQEDEAVMLISQILILSVERQQKAARAEQSS
jgi:hypothetical protein